MPPQQPLSARLDLKEREPRSWRALAAALVTGFNVATASDAITAGLREMLLTTLVTPDSFRTANEPQFCAVFSHRSAIRLKRLSLPTACSMRARAL